MISLVFGISLVILASSFLALEGGSIQAELKFFKHVSRLWIINVMNMQVKVKYENVIKKLWQIELTIRLYLCMWYLYIQGDLHKLHYTAIVFMLMYKKKRDIMNISKLLYLTTAEYILHSGSHGTFTIFRS